MIHLIKTHKKWIKTINPKQQQKMIKIIVKQMKISEHKCQTYLKITKNNKIFKNINENIKTI